jgi:putative DNA-invertase from lambdoid prophage Rac
LTPDKKAKVLAALNAGQTVSAVAKVFDTSRQTVMRVRDGAAGGDVAEVAEAA